MSTCYPMYTITQGDLKLVMYGEKAAKEACRALEIYDPYGGIPFTECTDMALFDALMYMQGILVNQIFRQARENGEKNA